MNFAPARKYRRKPSLTPMIDVVFLLLVFFMLASRFGVENVLPMPLASGGTGVSETPKLLDISPNGLRLNGIGRSPEQAIQHLRDLTQSPADPIILRARDGASVQRIVWVTQRLQQAGFTALVLAE
jgi:biopolymer transport protein ExbD